MLLVCSWAKWLTQLELVLVSYYHESTRSVTTLSGWDANPLQGYPPPPPPAFHQASLATNLLVPIYLYTLVGERHCESKVFCWRAQHIDSATSWIWIFWSVLKRTNHSFSISPLKLLIKTITKFSWMYMWLVTIKFSRTWLVITSLIWAIIRQCTLHTCNLMM